MGDPEVEEGEEELIDDPTWQEEEGRVEGRSSPAQPTPESLAGIGDAQDSHAASITCRSYHIFLIIFDNFLIYNIHISIWKIQNNLGHANFLR